MSSNSGGIANAKLCNVNISRAHGQGLTVAPFCYMLMNVGGTEAYMKKHFKTFALILLTAILVLSIFTACDMGENATYSVTFIADRIRDKLLCGRRACRHGHERGQDEIPDGWDENRNFTYAENPIPIVWGAQSAS